MTVLTITAIKVKAISWPKMNMSVNPNQNQSMWKGIYLVKVLILQYFCFFQKSILWFLGFNISSCNFPPPPGGLDLNTFCEMPPFQNSRVSISSFPLPPPPPPPSYPPPHCAKQSPKSEPVSEAYDPSQPTEDSESSNGSTDTKDLNCKKEHRSRWG